VARKASAKPAAKKALPRAGKPADKTDKGAKAAVKRAKAGQPQGSADKAAKLRVKLVRDSFTMPQVDFDLIDALKKRALGFRRPAKKSELLRAGLRALAALDDAQLGAMLESLPLLKPGRPKKAE
ncbi:MAG TPA: hypothetical protein VLA16_25555, partial [Ideonella sp.]|nr:hypothetical protein [Ideonella sp.]